MLSMQPSPSLLLWQSFILRPEISAEADTCSFAWPMGLLALSITKKWLLLQRTRECLRIVWNRELDTKLPQFQGLSPAWGWRMPVLGSFHGEMIWNLRADWRK